MINWVTGDSKSKSPTLQNVPEEGNNAELPTERALYDTAKTKTDDIEELERVVSGLGISNYLSPGKKIEKNEYMVP